MLMLLWPIVGWAAPSPELVEAVSKAYGKPVPAPAICQKPADLGAPWGEVTVVGVTQRNAGCRLWGVWVNDQLVASADFLATSSEGAFAKASPPEKLAYVETYVRKVLLAFDTLPRESVLKPTNTSKGYSVTVAFLQRRDVPSGSLATEGRFTFDAQGRVTASAREGGTPYLTRMIVNAYKPNGVDVDAVYKTLALRGGDLQDCFNAAWAEDLSLEGPVRLQWTISGGKAAAIGIFEEDERRRGLADCYSALIQTLPFPPDLSGTVVWSFTAERRQQE